MIISRPAADPSPRRTSRRLPPPASKDSGSEPEVSFDAWVDNKLSSKDADDNNGELVMDKSKRKYYRKRRKRMYGELDSDEENGRGGSGSDLIELKQEVVEISSVFQREEELYFYDTFAYPWEKNKHYRMVYQMEKKYFPDQGFDKAFLDPGEVNVKKDVEKDERKLMFFEGNNKEGKDVKVEDVTEKKVEDFFKCLKKFPNEKDEQVVEPFLSTRSCGLPPKWDGPYGTVVLINKPKGEFVSSSCNAF